MFFVLGGTLGLSLLILGLRLGALESFLVYFYGFEAGRWIPFSPFLENARNGCRKGHKKEAEMDAFPITFRVCPENAKVCVDCADVSGLRFRPLLFWFCASILVFLFYIVFSCFLDPLGSPDSRDQTGSAVEARPP